MKDSPCHSCSLRMGGVSLEDRLSMASMDSAGNIARAASPCFSQAARPLAMLSNPAGMWCELNGRPGAYGYARGGCQVTVMEALPQLLSGDVPVTNRQMLMDALLLYGVRMLTGTRIQAISDESAGVFAVGDGNGVGNILSCGGEAFEAGLRLHADSGSGLRSGRHTACSLNFRDACRLPMETVWRWNFCTRKRRNQERLDPGGRRIGHDVASAPSGLAPGAEAGRHPGFPSITR